MQETAYFGAGCFWGAELEFSKLNGVTDTEVGFSLIETSGTKKQRVETVKVDFNPNIITYPELIATFWSTHDPSNEQHKSDTYVEKSVLFGLNPKQINVAEHELDKKLKGETGKTIFTVIKPFISFERAPEKDQKYYFKKKNQ